ncbi:MAG: two-component regulator propeller domain-containing protein [Melioribacteraceae bacterium]|nr:two-component regulator propeller domain-containing protein [Melioribacteraceae bacterium]
MDDGLVQAQVDAIFQDSKGYMWFGTMGGVSRWDGKNFTNFETRNGLAALQIYDIAETSDGKILIACYAGGLSIYEDDKITSFTEADGLSTKWISVITIDNNGTIYLSGYDGILNIFDEGKITRHKLTSKKPFEGSVYDSYVTDDNEIYFATFGHGVYKLFNNRITQITTDDGLINNEVLVN